MTMPVVKVRIPEALNDLYGPEQERLLHSAFRQYARLRSQELLNEMQEAEAQLRQLEVKYGVSLAEFEAQLLPGETSVEVHEDYNRWFFWQSVMDRQREILERLCDVALIPDEATA
jgi:hypothetical protein